MIRLCASRACARLATPDSLEEWLDDPDADELLKVAADEMLFASQPFTPEWIAHPDHFNPGFATFPVRLTNYDPETVPSNTGLDLSRQVLHVMKQTG